jgi:ABC-type antimicrobial peptide transport system permease subunit
VPPTVYFSYRQDRVHSTYFAVRSTIPPLTLVSAARKAVAAVNANVPLSDITTQKAVRDSRISQETLFATLCGALASLAVLLSYIGLYGLMAYNVARRTGEIGIRMALGATRLHIVRPILNEALTLSALGVVAGVPLTLALVHLIKSQLYGIAATDPATLIGACVFLMAVAVLAAGIPAQRAARVNPMVALRSE